MLAFRGAGGEPPQQTRLRGLTFPLLPQESRTFRSNHVLSLKFAITKPF